MSQVPGLELGDLQVPASWGAHRRNASIVGAVAMVAMLAGFFLNREQFFRSWLLGWVFWVSLGLGSLAILMLQYLTGGAWGVVIRRPLEAGTRTLWLLALLFVPLAFGLRDLYVWARPEVVAADALLQKKAAYLNAPFFLARTAGYFAIWLVLAGLLNKWSAEQDRSGDRAIDRRIRTLCGPGLALYVLTITFASIDWVMSLEPHWLSAIFGLLMGINQVLSAHSFALAILFFLIRGEPMASLVNRYHLHDLAKLLFAFVMIWAYFAFSQYLIIWSGNLPEEITWYVARLQGGWQWFGLALIVLQFVVPFMLLLPRSFNFNSKLVFQIASLVLVMRWVDLLWTTAPAFHPASFSISWLDFAAPVAIGGLWISEYLRQLARRPVLPVGDPDLEEALQHGGH